MISSKLIFGLLIFIVFIHILATIYSWYWTIGWFDIPMHFLGGFWLAMVYFWLRQKRGLTQINTRINADNISVNQRTHSPRYRESEAGQRKSALLMIVSCLGFVALISVFWEFFEFFYDIFISSRGYSGFLQLGAADTLSDLFFDLLGGLVFVIFYLYRNTKRFKISP